MLAALVALLNVAIWTIPDSEGRAPVDGVATPEGVTGEG